MSSPKIRAKIVGATGYGGVGIIELLLAHPHAEIGGLVATTNIGTPISEVYPHLAGHCDLPILAADDPTLDQDFDVVFFATPDRVGMQLAPAELARGARVIDYSGDFRFGSTEAYADYATRLDKEPTHLAADLLSQSVYGLSEVRPGEIGSDTKIVGNPGCFAVSCTLGLAPAMKHALVDPLSVVCDAKTGVSGAGKKPSASFHFAGRYENMNAYRLSGHQHVCEVEHELARVGASSVTVCFTAHAIPQCRGILSTLYADLVGDVTAEAAVDAYRAYYANAPFVRIYERDAVVGTADVRGSNYCNLVVDVDARAGKLRIVSYIDNLMKGQAGSALQNMNLMFGLDERVGLDRPGQYP